MADAGDVNIRPTQARRFPLLSWMGDRDRVDATIPSVPPNRCPRCGEILPSTTRMWRIRVCPSCHLHMRLPARDRIVLLVDDGTFQETNQEAASRDPLDFHDDRSYRARLRYHQASHEQADALITGHARLGGIPVNLAVLDFTFMGGSMGLVVGEKLAATVDDAISAGRPLITIVASGGARMQEGMFALWQMSRTAAAMRKLRLAGLPAISILTDPTTGGVFASFASLADIILAEPEAMIGFAGPRVAEAMMGSPLPEGSHRAEYLLEHGHIDAIVGRPALRQTLLTILRIWSSAGSLDEEDARPQAPWRADPEASLPDPWSLTLGVRNPDRPSSRAYIERIVTDFLPLAGDRYSADDPAVIAGIGRISEIPVMIVALDRGHDRLPDQAPLHPCPAGFRKAHRMLTLAARWRLPVVMLVDTPGAWPGIESENEGLAAAIAQNLALLSDLPTPTVSVTIGEGGSGGALAMAVADRMLIQERAVFSVIPPEGAAAILFHDVSRAKDLASSLRLTARDLFDFGMVDGIVREPEGGAAHNADLAASLLEHAITANLDEIRRYSVRNLVDRRYERIRHLGEEHVQTPSRARRLSRWMKNRFQKRRQPSASGPAEVASGASPKA